MAKKKNSTTKRKPAKTAQRSVNKGFPKGRSLAASNPRRKKRT